MSGNLWVLGNSELELSQSADSATHVYESRGGSRRRGENFDLALLCAAAAAYRIVRLQYKVRSQPVRVERRTSPLILLSRAGSELQPRGRYISLDLEDFQ